MSIRLYWVWGVFAVLLTAARPSAAQQWVDDWFTSHTSVSAGGYESQQRGYYTLGSFQGRWRMSNDYLVSASPPRIKVGCGGIDMFGGAFSYLDPEFLVEKFERMIQAAPAFAFDLALQEFCKPCVAAMHGFEEVTDALNNIQINDCQMSRRVVQAVFDPDKSLRDEVRQEAASVRSVGDALRKNWQSFQDAARGSNGAPPDDTKPLTEGCPALFRQVYTDGSVVANVTRLLGLEGYADTMRGLIGDAIVTPRPTAFAVERLSGCPGNDQLGADDFLLGEFDVKGTDDRCVPSGSTRVVDVIENRLTAIAGHITANTPLTVEERAFIDNSPIPIYNLLRDAAIAGTTGNTITMIREPLAAAYAHRILDDLLKASQLVLEKAREVERDASGDPSVPGRCNTAFLADALDHVRDLAREAKSFRALAQANYTKKNGELLVGLEQSRALYELRRQTLNKMAGQMNSSR